jgi:hypothetical protein
MWNWVKLKQKGSNYVLRKMKQLVILLFPAFPINDLGSFSRLTKMAACCGQNWFNCKILNKNLPLKCQSDWSDSTQSPKVTLTVNEGREGFTGPQSFQRSFFLP